MEAASPSVELLISVISEVAACTQVSVSTITTNTIVLSRSPVTQSDTQALLPVTVTQSTSQPLFQVCIRTREVCPEEILCSKLGTNGDGNMSLLSDTFVCFLEEVLLRITKVSVWTPIRKFKAETSLDGQCRY